MDRGTYIEHDGRPAVRFERTYPFGIDRVWAAVTEPDELAHWFPSGVEVDLRVGGSIAFSGDPNTPPSTGTVLAVEAPRRLAFTWGGDELHLELEPVGEDGCRLILINVLEARDTAARNAAGWDVCLAELDKHVAGDLAAGPHAGTARVWRAHYEAYVAARMPAGAVIPGVVA